MHRFLSFCRLFNVGSTDHNSAMMGYDIISKARKLPQLFNNNGIFDVNLAGKIFEYARDYSLSALADNSDDSSDSNDEDEE